MGVPEAKTLEAKDAASPRQIRVRNRALILAAAAEVFATQCYRGPTTAPIHQNAGPPTATAPYYFGTTEASSAAVLEDIHGLRRAALDPHPQQPHAHPPLGAHNHP